VFVCFASPAEWIDVIQRVAPVFGQTDPEHAIHRIAIRFAGEIPGSIVTSAVHYRWVLVPAIAAAAALRYLNRSGERRLTAITSISFAVIAALFVARVIHMGHHGGPLRGVVQPYMALLAIAAVGEFARRWRTPSSPRSASRHAGLLIAVLLAAPLAGLFGSNRHWMMYWPLYATPWFAVLAAAAFSAGRALARPCAAPAAMLLVGSLAATQSIIGTIVSPMGMHQPRWNQTEVLAGFGALDGIRVDAETLRYLSALQHFAGPPTEDSDESIGLFCVEAEQLALRRRPWGGVWTLFYASDPEHVAAAMLTLPAAAPRTAVVIIHDRGASGGAALALNGLGLAFPEGYELRGNVTHPWTRRPVYVYVPRH
jgi:hypothetical protein